jgi:hypothetical protein
MTTDFEKKIYNTHLVTYRQKNNLPYTLRKNFKDLDDKTVVHLKRLANFFARFKHIDISEFFHAPYEIYPDDEYKFDLPFYISPKAAKIYTMYMQKRLNDLPDSPEQLEYIRKSLKYILQFCYDNTIEIDDYIKHKTNKINSFYIHLKEHHVCVYALFGFSGMGSEVVAGDKPYLEFMLKDIFSKLDLYRTKYYSSKVARPLVQRGIEKIKETLKKKLNSGVGDTIIKE